MSPKRLQRGAIGPGHEVGRLVVEADSGARANGYIVWLCRCEPRLGGCGRLVPVMSCNLRKKRTRSCGCLHAEASAARLRARHAR